MRFSIVCAVHDVARYLPEFIDSVENQDHDLSTVEVVVVDDGSTDGSPALLRAWAERRPELVRLITQPYAGPAAARNAGLAAATGDWVTFPEPEDALGRKYLRSVDRYLTRNPGVDLVATERVVWSEATGERTRTHPLRVFFRGSPLIALGDSPLYFHDSAAAAFFPTDRLRAAGLEFAEGLAPHFDGGHLVGRYLLTLADPKVGFLRQASYYTRKQADLDDPARYTTVFERGYASLVATAREQRGAIPAWLGSLLAHELVTHLGAAENPSVRLAPAPADVEALHRGIGDLLAHPEIRESLLQVRYPVSRTVRLALLHGYGSDPWVDDHVLADRHEERTGLVRARYYFVGDPPAERVLVGGAAVAPAYQKVRDVRFLGKVLLRERLLWTTADPDLAIETGGSLTHLCSVRPPFDHVVVGPRWLAEHLQPKQAAPLPGIRSSRREARDFAGAWVFLDKIHEGNDNAEHLFRYVRREHPGINAYFVVARDSATWTRLRREGHGRRLVAHGSSRWRSLMAHCTEVISSHCELAVFAPPEILALITPTWRFTFLPHGVTKDDLSHWFGRRPIDLLVTTTAAEHASIAGDGSGYPFTEKEVHLTGLPRLDALRAAASARGPADRDVLLVAPTWRNWLVGPLPPGEQRQVMTADASDSDYVRSWRALLADPALAETARAHDAQVTFLPHPNVEPLLSSLGLPDHVRVVGYAEVDVQELFARTRLLLTDYSSVAFDAASIEVPVVYFQFDGDRVRQGAHSTTPGYFDYVRDGFGPVATDHAEVLDRIGETLAAGPVPTEPYRGRSTAAFGHLDGGCCERAVQLLLDGSR